MNVPEPNIFDRSPVFVSIPVKFIPGDVRIDKYPPHIEAVKVDVTSFDSLARSLRRAIARRLETKCGRTYTPLYLSLTFSIEWSTTAGYSSSNLAGMKSDELAAQIKMIQRRNYQDFLVVHYHLRPAEESSGDGKESDGLYNGLDDSLGSSCRPHCVRGPFGSLPPWLEGSPDLSSLPSKRRRPHVFAQHPSPFRNQEHPDMTSVDGPNMNHAGNKRADGWASNDISREAPEQRISDGKRDAMEDEDGGGDNMGGHESTTGNLWDSSPPSSRATVAIISNLPRNHNEPIGSGSAPRLPAKSPAPQSTTRNPSMVYILQPVEIQHLAPPPPAQPLVQP
ncbi:hypothetical protein GGS20DRAFT_581860 [Poronia punctata]|nr:hypothetical protein GGS20DRAFT_581860 [Poronia punctata]